MIGAIAGDVLGSVYEAQSTKDKGFRLFHELDRPTDDSVLSLAIASAILESDGKPCAIDYTKALREFGLSYPDAGYGGGFRRWMNKADADPYNSWGNGSAMRASAVGWAFDSEAEVLRQAELSASPTHNHPEGVKGAQAVALTVFLARNGASKDTIRDTIERRFGYDLKRSVEGIRPGYGFDVSCQGSVPESIIAFLDSTDFEDALRNAISLGGDADTMACIAGAIAEAFYGAVPPIVLAWVVPRLDARQLDVLHRFSNRWLPASQRGAVKRELAARALVGPGSVARNPRRPAPPYRLVIHGALWQRVQDYAGRLAADPSIAGKRLKASLARLPIRGADAAWLIFALVNTKLPQIFAESEVVGDGSDWTREELGLLGDIGMAVPVTVFDDGRHQAPAVHARPFAAKLLYVPGALLRSGHGEPADREVVKDEAIDVERYEALYERRLLPLLRFASDSAQAGGRQALVTVPGLGCGQFAGNFRGTLGTALRNALVSILRRHGASLAGIRAIWFDPYDECQNERLELGHISFFVRPLRASGPGPSGRGRPQLCRPESYAEDGDDFSGCDLFSMVAWDHVSWPGNDYWGGARSTDDGVKAAATDSMFALTGFRGAYDPECSAYLPPQGVRTWEELVIGHGLLIRTIDNVIVVGMPSRKD